MGSLATVLSWPSVSVENGIPANESVEGRRVEEEKRRWLFRKGESKSTDFTRASRMFRITRRRNRRKYGRLELLFFHMAVVAANQSS